MSHVDSQEKRRSQTPVTGKMLNGMLQLARGHTSDITAVISRYDQLQDALAPQVEQVGKEFHAHKEAVEASFEAALEQALLGHSTETIGADNSVLSDAVLPETTGQLERRLQESQEYFDASIGQVEGLSPNVRNYASAMYACIAHELIDVAQSLSADRGRLH